MTISRDKQPDYDLLCGIYDQTFLPPYVQRIKLEAVSIYILNNLIYY